MQLQLDLLGEPLRVGPCRAQVTLIYKRVVRSQQLFIATMGAQQTRGPKAITDSEPRRQYERL